LFTIGGERCRDENESLTPTLASRGEGRGTVATPAPDHLREDATEKARRPEVTLLGDDRPVIAGGVGPEGAIARALHIRLGSHRTDWGQALDWGQASFLSLFTVHQSLTPHPICAHARPFAARSKNHLPHQAAPPAVNPPSGPRRRGGVRG